MRVLLAVVVVGLLAGTGCTRSVEGRGELAVEVPVPPSATAAPSSPSTPAPAPSTPAPAPSTPAPRPTGPAAPAPGTVPTAYAGIWRGVMSQPRSVLPSWTAVLVLPAGRRAGTFLVAGVCSGTATVLSASEAALVLRETIQQDPSGRCASAGTVTLTRAGGGRLRMSWVDAAVPDNVASGILDRS